MIELPVNYKNLHFSEVRIIREEYIRQQKGICCYCNKPLSGLPDKGVLMKEINRKLFPDNFFKWPIHLHHNHKTGMTIGAVHNYCNAVSFQYDGV